MNAMKLMDRVARMTIVVNNARLYRPAIPDHLTPRLLQSSPLHFLWKPPVLSEIHLLPRSSRQSLHDDTLRL